MENVIPFRRRSTNAGYAPGVVPFDVHNPAHIEAWNQMFHFFWAERKFIENERAERAASLGVVQ